MCGILGYIAHGDHRPNAKQFKKALENCAVRGHDATGIYTPENGILKLNLEATKFIAKFDDDIDKALKSNILLAHCRATTKGIETDNKNNHPHESDNFILVHNGMISRSEKPKDYKFRSDCDSETILAYVETYGIEEGINKMNEYDNMSIALYEKATGLVYLFRNTNPAHIILDRKYKITYFASTKEILAPMIRWAPTLGWNVWDSFNSFDTDPKKLFTINIAEGLIEEKEIKQTFYAPKNQRQITRTHYGYGAEGYYTADDDESDGPACNVTRSKAKSVNEMNSESKGVRKVIYRGGAPRIVIDNFQSALV
jgi:asparagine synthetase B (glutamine-hydrolysing)